MNVDDLTIKEAKELASLFSGNVVVNKQDYFIGEYVIVRSRNEGINCGVVVQHDETGVVLKEARRIWYHKPKDRSLAWYEGVATSGLSDDSKISSPVEKKLICEDYSLTLCTSKAAKSLSEYKSYEQN